MDFPLKLDNTPSINQVFTPVNIAILASLGLHAFVLGLALPNLTWPEPTEEGFEDRAPVGVIELTPAEQSRLPNTDPLPANPLLPVLPGDETPPSLPTEPNLPAAPDSNYDYQLPDSSSLPPLPSMPPLPNLPAYPNLPPLTSYDNLSRLPIQNPPLPSLPPLPSRRLPRLPSPSTSKLPNNDLDLPPISPNDPARPRFDPLPPPQGTDFITRAPQGRDGDNSDNGNGVSQPVLMAEGEDSSPEQVQLNSLNSIAKQGVAIRAKDVVPGAYPQIACRNRTEASVIYNVFPSGQKDLVGRSRYPIFNDLAAKAIGSRSYAQPTQVTVSFQYDPKVCAGVNQFGTPQAPQTPQMPANQSPQVAPTTAPTDSSPSPAAPSSPAGETPSAPPASLPNRPARTPAPAPQPAGETPTPQDPLPQASPVPDAPVPSVRPPASVTPQPTPAAPRPTSTPRPAATPTPISQPRSTPVAQPTPSVAPAPASPAPQRSLPKSKGDILRERNQAPFVPPTPQPPPEADSADSTQSHNQPPWNQ